MTRPFPLLKGILGAALLLFTACAATVLTTALTAATAEAASLKVAHSTWVGFGPFYVAREKGFFAAEGLDVELIVMEDVKTRLPALAAGRVDVTTTTVDTVLNFYSARRPFRYLFAIDDSKGGDGIVADKDIRAVADLKGKKVAFSEGSVSQFYLSVLLKENGLSLADVEMVNMDAGSAGAAFVARRVQAAVTWEPWLTRGRAGAHGHVLVDSSSSPGLITDVALTTEATLKARTADLRAFYRAGSGPSSGGRPTRPRRTPSWPGRRRLAQETGGLQGNPRRRRLLRRRHEPGFHRHGREAGRDHPDHRQRPRPGAGSRPVRPRPEARFPHRVRDRQPVSLVSYLTNSVMNLRVLFAVGCVTLPRVVPATARHRALPTTKMPSHLHNAICETGH